MTIHQMNTNPQAQAIALHSPVMGTLRLRKEARGTVRRKTIDLKNRMNFSRVIYLYIESITII